MAEPKTKTEEKMEKLAAVVKRGWAKAHPVTEAQRQAVAGAMREQWSQAQSGKNKPPAISKTVQPKQKKQRTDMGPEL